MLIELFTWWATQMSRLLPRHWAVGARYADAIVLRPQVTAGRPSVSAAIRRRGVETAIGIVEPGGAAIRRVRARKSLPALLALPQTALLQQQVNLPLAAERDLGAVLGHEMDRLTPFKPADLFWTWRIQSRDRAAGRLLVCLLLVPKAAVAASLSALQPAGLVPTAIEVATPDGLVNLPLSTPGARAGERFGVRAAAITCGALAVAVCAVPVLLQERAIARAEQAVADLRPRVAEVEALRRRLAVNATGSDLFSGERSRVGNPLRGLSAVNSALPDDTYLTSFAMRQRAMLLSGRSAAAVKLIGLLASSPDLSDPAFDAPVTRGSGGGDPDVFSIRVTLRP